MPTSIFKTSSVLFLLFITSRVLGFVREQVVAAYLGATPQSDAYVVASTIPFILSYILGTSGGNSFLPVFTERLGKQNEKQLASTFFAIYGGGIVLFSAAGIIFAPQLVEVLAPGFTADTKSLAVLCTRIMLPGLAFLTMGYLVKAALNAYKHFTVPAAAPALQNIVFILLLFFFVQKGAVGLAWCMLGGTLVFYLVQRTKLWNYGFTLKPRLNFRDSGVRRIFVLAVPVILTTLSTKGYIFLDRWLGSQLSGGSIAALNFADRIRELPYGLFVAAVSTVLFPYLASAAGRGDMNSLRENTAKGMRLVALLGFPAAILLLTLDRPVVRLLFERGAFDASATAATAGALEVYALSVIALSANQLMIYTFLSLQEAVIPFKIMGCALGINLLLDLILVGSMQHIGLALGNTVSAFVAAILFMILLHRRLEDFNWRDLLKPVGKIAAAAAVFGIVIVGVSSWLGLYAAEVALSKQIWGLTVTLGVGGIIYAGLLFILRVEDFRSLLKK
ncbi:MAG: murein biosynthesis integral membrane protein MurJ [Clostridiales bacterium]|nr:murein biosynthesis integral membrane protein MurJ [Clostridiales bacterium]MCF8022970.1 murein biosynthesis integral membrane protein MurJ [Clostridiales bacterium]